MSTLADRTELQLRREAPAGAERLIRELLRRGLPVEAIEPACRLVAELEAVCSEQRGREQAA